MIIMCIPRYSQTSLIRSFFIRIPRHLEENRLLPIYSLCHAYIQYVCSIIRFPRLSGYFRGKRMCAAKQGLTVTGGNKTMLPLPGYVLCVLPCLAVCVTQQCCLTAAACYQVTSWSLLFWSGCVASCHPAGQVLHTVTQHSSLTGLRNCTAVSLTEVTALLSDLPNCTAGSLFSWPCSCAIIGVFLNRVTVAM